VSEHLAQGCGWSITPEPRLEPGPPDHESGELTTRPSRLNFPVVIKRGKKQASLMEKGTVCTSFLRTYVQYCVST
jgi:hypothetical protein